MFGNKGYFSTVYMDDTTGVVHTVEKYTTYADRILKSLTLYREMRTGD